MTESQWNSSLTAFLNSQPDCMAFKHADGFTEGVPDMSVTVTRVGTTWLEVKRLKPNENFRARAFEKARRPQLMNMLRLGSISRAFYVMTKQGFVHIFHPAGLLQSDIMAGMTTVGTLGMPTALIQGCPLRYREAEAHEFILQLVRIPLIHNLARSPKTIEVLHG